MRQASWDLSWTTRSFEYVESAGAELHRSTQFAGGFESSGRFEKSLI